jgi:hypothetical protein
LDVTPNFKNRLEDDKGRIESGSSGSHSKTRFQCFVPSAHCLWAGNKTGPGDEFISLTAKNEPLGDVLKKISMATGYEIILDNNWRGYPVTVSIEDIPLNKGLKRILKDLNNVIVYVSSKKIKIIIYDKISPDRGSSISPGRSYLPPASGTLDSQALEREEAAPDNSAVSGEESEPDVSEHDESKNKKLENFKPKTDEGPLTNIEDTSSKGRSGQKNQSESSSGEGTESSQGPESSGNNK